MSALSIELVHHHAKLPTKAHTSDAGYDLYSCEKMLIRDQKSAIVRTGIKANLPHNYYGRIASRSGLAAKHGIDVAAGVIDNGYHGEIMVLLRNHGPADYEINIGDKIAQMILEQYGDFPVVLVDSVAELSKTTRGESGFGSSGK
jgi:dUTP pyrophosphatase